MTRPWPVLALGLVVGFLGVNHANFAVAQISVSGGRSVVKTSEPVVVETPVRRSRRPWRDRNPFYLARPVYPPARPGARANVTFEPFTSKYYPTPDSYYPRLPVPQAARPR